MKKYFATIAIISLLVACGGGTSADANKDSGAAGSETAVAGNAGGGDISQNPDYQKGLDLIGSSDCLTCHKVNEKLVGPSYEDVANKYAGVDTAMAHLSHKIIAGGKGVWDAETNGAIMTPHPQVSQADAEQMVKYILLLKTK